MKTFVLQEKELEYYIKYAKKQGFTHIKAEFEGQLDRGSSDSSYCDDCSGNGYYECDNCDGSGEVSTDTDSIYEECPDCDSTGRTECQSCDGSGSYNDGGYDEDFCDDYIRNCLSEDARLAMVYGNFYEDGSVDSEYTCTFKVEDIRYLLEVSEAFDSLASHIGNGISTDNAGFHMALMTAGNYPSDTTLDEPKLVNYKKSMTKLIPALIFLGSASRYTRGFGYRQLQISNDKYSLINTGGSVLEFRVFDTCYDNPEQMLDNFIVMAKSLQFYSDTYIEPVFRTKAVIDIYTNNSMVEDFYYTAKHLDILEESLRYLRPTYKTMQQLKQQREFNITKAELAKKRKEQATLAKHGYKNYQYKVRIERKLEELSARQDWLRCVLNHDTDYAVDRYGTLAGYIQSRISNVRRMTRSQYVESRINNNISRYDSPAITLTY